MLNEIKEILAEYIDLPEEGIDESTSFQGELSINSYELMNIIMAFEEKFSISISDRDVIGLQTVGDVIKYIEEQKK